METLQKQVTTLNHKVEALYQVIDQLNGKVSEALSECRLAPVQGTNGVGGDGLSHHPAQGYSSVRPVMEHKDVLVDKTGLNSHTQSGEKQLTPESQIQRLTAQLTAAYNRIAALEEQLLAQRVH